ncbi:sodium-independent sulfate anion transporter-like [Oratosquilla oratoria]|uniref:sodium-independent sulfate anion transporter-like n=1 Tax=Oratosquilla oratoria TaxID=337810 RepID=UPI003F75E224
MKDAVVDFEDGRDDRRNLRSRSALREVENFVRKKARRIWCRKNFERRLPPLAWLPKYSGLHIVGDIVAGFTVSLMIIPQGLAYGLVAGLPPIYGLYSSFVGCMVYALLGTVPELALGPTAVLAILTKPYSSRGGTDYAVLLCFLSGIVEVTAGVANLGFLTTFISRPVISGFTSAAAVTIWSMQLKGLLGLDLETKGVVDTWVQISQNLTSSRWEDLTLGLACVCVIMVLKVSFRRKKDAVVDFEDGRDDRRNLRSRSALREVENFVRKKARRIWCRKNFERRLPPLAWLPKYSGLHIVGDIVAGFTVSLMIIPQGLAYGLVAGLPPIYGLYSSFVGCMVYALLGTVPELALGPTAVLAILTKPYSSRGGTDYAVLLCFLSGIVEVTAGVANLGFLTTFISRPVISGFTSAAAVTIWSMQLKGLLGLDLETKGVVDTWVQISQNLTSSRWEDLTLGLACVCVIMVLKELPRLQLRCLGEDLKTSCERVTSKILFFLSVSRNAIVVLLSTGVAYALRGDHQPFTLTGTVAPGVPQAQLPPLRITVHNETLSFREVLGDLGVGVVMVPAIAILYHIAIATTFARGRAVDATQEILALGVANIVGSFFRSMPTAGCLSRSAVNSSSGVRTPAGGLITGTLVLLALTFLTPAFSFIPKATLSAVIICAVASMVDYESLLPLWRTSKVDLLPLGVTFVVSILWGFELGILLGVGANLALLLCSFAKPSVEISEVAEEKVPGGIGAYVLARPSHGAPFPSSSHLRKELQKAGLREGGGTLPVVVDCECVFMTDFTTAQVVKSLVGEFVKRNQLLVFLNLRPDVEKTLRALCPSLLVCPSTCELRQLFTETSSKLIKDGKSDSESLILLENGSQQTQNENSKEEDILLPTIPTAAVNDEFTLSSDGAVSRNLLDTSSSILPPHEEFQT